MRCAAYDHPLFQADWASKGGASANSEKGDPMLKSNVMPDGRILKLNPLVENAVLSGAKESVERLNTDDVAAVRYLYLAQGFSCEDLSCLTDGKVSAKEFHKLYLKQKTRASLNDALPVICEKLGISPDLFLIHARAWLDNAQGRGSLPFFIPVLSPIGEETDECMWFSIQWLRERFKTLDGVSAFKVADNNLASCNYKAGDYVFLSKHGQTPFVQSAVYLIKGYDDAWRLRQAAITVAKGKPSKKFVIPGMPEASIDADCVPPENNLGKVVYTLSQNA